jgi:beta-glucosidase/6-phospho-beta-glucosidase/beta-galactosidase
MRWSLLPLVLSACEPAPERLKFPSTFLFGTATAGFQVEMGCPTVAAAECEDRNSDWYTWITSPELVMDSTLHITGESPADGPGFYELYAQDLDRAKNELRHNGFRLSIEWSRLFPTATDGISGHDALKAAASPAALAYYHALFAALKARGLVPLVTLNHYSLPTWIHDALACHRDIDTCVDRGWLDHDRIVGEMAKYAGFCAEEFGGEVDRWASLNEPLTAVILAGFLFQTAQRTNPPGVFLRADAAHTAFANMIEAHARVYDAVKAADTADADGDGKPAEVGVVYNLEPVVPDDPTNPADVQAAKNADYLINQAFLDGLTKGAFDANLTGMPTVRGDLAGKLDFLGINYYAQLTVQGADSSFFPDISPLLTFNPIALKYDYQYPKGIYEVIKSAAARYHVPIIITETGVDDGADSLGSDWIVKTLHWVKRAMNEGVRVDGYFYWSLMDNYEWNHGMSIKMGLYAVDPTDSQKRRKARSSVATFAAIAAAGEIPADLAAKYPVK